MTRQAHPEIANAARAEDRRAAGRPVFAGPLVCRVTSEHTSDSFVARQSNKRVGGRTIRPDGLAPTRLSQDSLTKKALAARRGREPRQIGREPLCLPLVAVSGSIEHCPSRAPLGSRRLVCRAGCRATDLAGRSRSRAAGIDRGSPRRSTARLKFARRASAAELTSGAQIASGPAAGERLALSGTTARWFLHSCPPVRGKGRQINAQERPLLKHPFLFLSYFSASDFQGLFSIKLANNLRSSGATGLDRDGESAPIAGDSAHPTRQSDDLAPGDRVPGIACAIPTR